MDNWWVYIIEKKTGLYVGITTDLENRMLQHEQPVPLYYEGPVSKTEALKRERTLKGWSRKKKLELICKSLLKREMSFARACQRVLLGEPFREENVACVIARPDPRTHEPWAESNIIDLPPH